jgi:hypothetical protein
LNVYMAAVSPYSERKHWYTLRRQSCAREERNHRHVHARVNKSNNNHSSSQIAPVRTRGTHAPLRGYRRGRAASPCRVDQSLRITSAAAGEAAGRVEVAVAASARQDERNSPPRPRPRSSRVSTPHGPDPRSKPKLLTYRSHINGYVLQYCVLNA